MQKKAEFAKLEPMKSVPSPRKLREWQERAARKSAIVPEYFEVFVQKVHLRCGQCFHEFQRPLVPNLNEPVFVCPNEECRARNWIPLRYKHQ